MGSESKTLQYMKYLYTFYPRIKQKVDGFYSTNKQFIFVYEDAPNLSYGDFNRAHALFESFGYLKISGNPREVII